MLSQKFLDSQRKVAELEQQMRDLQEQQIPHVSAAMCRTCALAHERSPLTFDLALIAR